MSITREHLGPAARAYYDAQKAQSGRPKSCPTCHGVPGNTACVLCRGTGVWNPLPSAMQPTPPAMPSPIAQRVRKGIRDSKRDMGEFMNICDKAGVERPVTEHIFHPVRKWRLDAAWPRYRLALEVDGGAFVGGRHNQGAGFKKDNEKLNSAIVLGWRVLRITPDELLKAETVDLVRRAMRGGRR